MTSERFLLRQHASGRWRRLHQHSPPVPAAVPAAHVRQPIDEEHDGAGERGGAGRVIGRGRFG